MITGKCISCKSKLIHYEDSVFVKCSDCGVKEKSQITCEKGHYYCNACASKKVLNRLYEELNNINDKNPIDAAEKLIRECGICGNSPHPITTAAFLLAYKNLTGEITEEQVLEGVMRATQIPGGWCGYYGNCGAAVGMGVAFAIIQKSTPMHDKERSIANKVTADGLQVVAEQGGPRCCAGSVRGVVEKSVELAERYLGVKFPEKTSKMTKCWVSAFNDDCRGARCSYYENV